MVENFDVGGRCIQLEGHRIPFTIKDVATMLGIKNEGDDVDEVLKGTNWSKLLLKYDIDKNVKFPQLEDRIKSLDVDSVEIKACMLMYVVGVFLYPTSSASSNKKYFNCPCESGMSGKLNWAQHAHDYLIRGIESYLGSDRNHAYLNGCVLLLEVRLFDFWSRVITKDFDFNVRGPRIKSWEGTDADALLSRHKELRGPFTLKAALRKGKETDSGRHISSTGSTVGDILKDQNGLGEDASLCQILNKMTDEMCEIKKMIKGMEEQNKLWESRIGTLESRVAESVVLLTDKANEIDQVEKTVKSKGRGEDTVLNEPCPPSTGIEDPSQPSVKKIVKEPFQMSTRIQDPSQPIVKKTKGKGIAACSKTENIGKVSNRITRSMGVDV